MNDHTCIAMSFAQSVLVVSDAPTPAIGNVRTLTWAIVRGDEDAFNQFYREYSPRVFRFLIVVTGGKEDLSAELHQRVMITAGQKLRVFETEAELWAWLAQVARNKWKDLLRKQCRHARAMESVPEQRNVGISSETVDRLNEALLELPETERQLVESFYFDDLSQWEISRTSGRSVKAIQCALARLRTKLKKLLK